jgi:SAM-dependent methyltransferase
MGRRAEHRDLYLRRMQDHFRATTSGFPPEDTRFVGWGSESSQRARFAALASAGLLGEDSVLDVGCGTGALAGWLREMGWKGRYTGIDILPGMIKAARRLHARERFQVATVSRRSVRSADWVVASGIFFLPARDWDRRVARALKAMLRKSRTGVAANFLSARSPRRDRASKYVDPGAVLRLALKVSPRVALRHDYLPNDFTVFLLKAIK